MQYYDAANASLVARKRRYGMVGAVGRDRKWRKSDNALRKILSCSEINSGEK